MLLGAKILITGGASGLGIELAKHFLDEGSYVHVIDIKPPTYEHENLSYQEMDLIKDLPKSGEYDIFVSNVAYYPGVKEFYDYTEEEIEKDIRLNITVPLMIIKNIKFKRILFINSITSFQGFSFAPMYCASKAYMHNFNQALRQTGIQTTIAYPHKIKTPLFNQLNVGEGYEPKYVAKCIVDGFKAGQSEIFVPSWARMYSYTQFLNYRIQDIISWYYRRRQNLPCTENSFEEK